MDLHNRGNVQKHINPTGIPFS